MERLERLAGRLARGVSQLDAENTDELFATANLVTEVTEELALRGSRECLEPQPERAPAAEGNKTALVVDSSRRDRTRLCGMLVKLGYQVIEAERGAEALALCEQCDGPLHVMFTDLFLDDMSGREVAERGSVLKPEMHVIYMSGCAEEVLRCGIVSQGGMTLRKPVSTEALTARLNAVAQTQYA